MKKNLKSTLAVAIVAASATIGYVSYTQYQQKQLAYTNPLMEENIEALALEEGRSGYWAGWVDSCVRMYTAEKTTNIYDSASNSTNVSAGANYNPATQEVGANGSYSNANNGQKLIGQVKTCEGWSFHQCHLGDCTKYENGQIVPSHADCKAKLGV